MLSATDIYLQNIDLYCIFIIIALICNFFFMKSLSLQKIFLITACVSLPIFGFANTQLTAEQMAEKLEKLLADYRQKVVYLEAENKMLKQIMEEQNVQIPLSRYKEIEKLRWITTPADTSNNSQNNTTSPASQNTASSVSVNLSASTAGITDTQYLGFINQIHKDWENIKPFYKIRQEAVIGGYEFVPEGENNNVFVDILYYGNTLSGSYDAKLLYKYDKNTFKRELVGFFEFDENTWWYITRRGSNPFSGVTRRFVADPYLVRFPVIYSLSENANTTTTTTGQTKPVQTSPSNPTAPTQSATENTSEINAIKTAYNNDQYISVIQKSDDYLKKYQPNLEVLSLRYRTYFIIAQYDNALGAISTIKAKGWLSNKIACDAYVIASYAKNTSLANTYKKQAGSSCKSI